MLDYTHQLLVDEAKWLQEDGRMDLAARVYRLAHLCKGLAEEAR